MTGKFCTCFLTLRTVLGTPGTLPQAPTNPTSLTVLQTQPQRFQSPSPRLLPRCLLLMVTFLPLDPSDSMPGSPTPVARPHVQTTARPLPGPCSNTLPSLPNLQDFDVTFKTALEGLLCEVLPLTGL